MCAAVYLAEQDYASYGVPFTVTPAQVQDATSLINGFLKRPEGVLVGIDGMGNPAYMSSLSPSMALATTAAIAPGLSVVVPVAGGMLGFDTVGAPVVLDRMINAKIEVCIITAFTPANGLTPATVTLAQVLYAHDTAATIEFGLAIQEQRMLPDSRSIMYVSRRPISRILAGVGRYGYGRRSDQTAGVYSDFNLLATIQSFGGPPQWVPFDVSQTSVSLDTNQVWIPAGILLAYYSEVRLWYVSGWTYATLPSQIKQACANLVNSNISAAGLPGSLFKKYQAGDTAIERFADQAIDDATRRLLLPYQSLMFL